MNLFGDPFGPLIAAVRHAEFTAVGIAVCYPVWRCFVGWAFRDRRR